MSRKGYVRFFCTLARPRIPNGPAPRAPAGVMGCCGSAVVPQWMEASGAMERRELLAAGARYLKPLAHQSSRGLRVKTLYQAFYALETWKKVSNLGSGYVFSTYLLFAATNGGPRQLGRQALVRALPLLDAAGCPLHQGARGRLAAPRRAEALPDRAACSIPLRAVSLIIGGGGYLAPALCSLPASMHAHAHPRRLQNRLASKRLQECVAQAGVSLARGAF